MKFDGILAKAEALLVEHPVRNALTEAEIKAISDYFYAHELGADQELREKPVESPSTAQRSTRPARAHWKP